MKTLDKAPNRPNIGWLFYKDYFKDEKGEYFFNKNIDKNRLITKKINNILNQKLTSIIPLPLEQYLELKTIYPGLLIGSGYQHEIGGIKEEFQLGFFFDYTTGMPIVSGSSVKGVLRSLFPYTNIELKYLKEKYKSDKMVYENIVKINSAKESYIQSIIDKEIDIFQLKKEIFEDKRDRFFDAFIVKTDNRYGRFLDDDYITPHSDEFKDPIPLRFLKVSSGVTFRFYFDLEDSMITKEEKLVLFDNILQDFGVGAKRNVGYGQFTGENKKRIKGERDEKK